LAKKGSSRNLLIITLLVIAAVGAAGAWYYFYQYVPKYEAERERLLTIYTISDPVEMDPALAGDADSNRIVMNVFDRLIEYKKGTTELVPSLATSWEKPDSTTFIFTLKSGVKFQDGSAFSASDVKYSFDRVIELNGAPSYILYVINNTEVLDPTHVKITLNYDFAPFLSILAHPVASIVSKTAVEKYGEGFTKNPVGTGPFTFKSWTLNKEVVLVANKEYFKGAPKLEKVVFKTIYEAEARKTALESGELDAVIGGGIPQEDLPELAKNPDIRIYKGNSTSVEYLGFNMLIAPLNDTRVREAISYAIDYNAIINDALGGIASRIGGPIAPSIFGYEEQPLRQRDTVKAKQLLAEAGYANGFEITLTYNIETIDRRKMAESIRESLLDVGITVKIKGLDWDSAINEYLSMGHELMLNGWTPDYYDADAYLSPQFHTNSLAPNGANVFGLSDPELDSYIDEGMTSLSTQVRLQAYSKAQKKIVEDLPCLFLAVPQLYDCTRYNVKNWTFSPIEVVEYYDIYKE
jgi:peptide/nickel transport system substrate-binding protein